MILKVLLLVLQIFERLLNMASILLRNKSPMRREQTVLKVGPICMGEYNDFSKSIHQYLNKQAILNAKPLDKNANIEQRNKLYAIFLDFFIFLLPGYKQIHAKTFLDVTIGSIAQLISLVNPKKCFFVDLLCNSRQ